MPLVPAATAPDAGQLAREELQWYRENPEPKSTPPLEALTENDDTLILWNFPIAKADLAQGHRDVLEKFAAPGLLAETPAHPRLDFDVVGHASITGAEQSNQDYARQRAETVKEYLEAFGIKKVTADSRGSSQPDDEGTSGQALARNRRVTIKRSVSTYRVVDPTPPPRLPAETGPEPSTPRETIRISLALTPKPAPRVVIAPFIIGDLKVGVRGGDPVKAGVITRSGSQPALTDEFEKKLVEILDPRLGVSGGEGKDPVSINVGIAAEEWFQTPKVVYQHGENFISFNFRAVQARFLPVVPFNGVEVILEFSGSIRFDIGPSDTAAGTFPSTSDPGPNVKDTQAEFIPVQPRALAIAATITDAGTKASRLAQEDIKKMVLNLARRDGAACWAAWEVTDDDPSWRQMQVNWRDKVGPDAEKEWLKGNKQVEDMLKALEKAEKGARDKRAGEWKTKYGGAASKPDFEFVREAVFQQLKGYDEDEGDLQQLIDGL